MDSRKIYPPYTKHTSPFDPDEFPPDDARKVNFNCLPDPYTLEELDTRRAYPSFNRYSPVVDKMGHASLVAMLDVPRVNFRSCLPYSALSQHRYLGQSLDRKDYAHFGQDSPGDIYQTYKVYEQGSAAKWFNSNGKAESKHIKWTMRPPGHNSTVLAMRAGRGSDGCRYPGPGDYAHQTPLVKKSKVARGHIVTERLKHGGLYEKAVISEQHAKTECYGKNSPGPIYYSPLDSIRHNAIRLGKGWSSGHTPRFQDYALAGTVKVGEPRWWVKEEAQFFAERKHANYVATLRPDETCWDEPSKFVPTPKWDRDTPWGVANRKYSQPITASKKNALMKPKPTKRSTESRGSDSGGVDASRTFKFAICSEDDEVQDAKSQKGDNQAGDSTDKILLPRGNSQIGIGSDVR